MRDRGLGAHTILCSLRYSDFTSFLKEIEISDVQKEGLKFGEQ